MRALRKSLLAIVAGFATLAAAPGQTLTEFPLPEEGALPTAIIAGPDGNLWFIEARSSRFGWPKIGRITTTGSVVDFSVEEGFVALPNDIASGPDGNIWFTQADIDGGHSALNRMSPSGVLTRFRGESVFPGALYPSFTGPWGITAGPRGNLWVTLNEENAVGEFTPGGVLRRFYAIPTPGSRPTSITAGPDGNLWFTESFGNRIGRITSDGVITEFSIPTPSSHPADIAAGSDGNLWFTEANAKNIGRITPDGVITEFAVPRRGIQIAAGPDGALWFTQPEARIGRITTSGLVTEIPIPAVAGGITTGPDGNIWFTEFSAGKIGRIELTRAPAIETRILPVVGSTPGSRGTFFKTSVQLHNPSSAQISGRITFHRTGVPGSDSDPALAYVLSPGQTQSIADLLPAIGHAGLGSADVEVTAGPPPAMTARVFNDAGAAGTTGFTEEPMRAEDALSPGHLLGTLLVPADSARYRFNVGVRTLAEGATVTFVLRNAAGAEVGRSARNFQPSYHEQASASEFLRVPEIPPGGSVAISVTNGSAIFYGATVDNVTGDPSLQIARARGPWDL